MRLSEVADEAQRQWPGRPEEGGNYFRKERAVASAELAAGSEMSERPNGQEQKRLGCEQLQLEMISIWSDKLSRRLTHSPHMGKHQHHRDARSMKIR
jgi:hypothetical protein